MDVYMNLVHSYTYIYTILTQNNLYSVPPTLLSFHLHALLFD